MTFNDDAERTLVIANDYDIGNYYVVLFRSPYRMDERGRGHDKRFSDILFQSFLQEAIVNSFRMGRDVQSLMLSIQHFLCPPSKVP